MRCDEVMVRAVERISVWDAVQTAALRMRAAEVGFLPVCDEDGTVVGTLTDRDIVLRLVADDKPAHVPVKAIMTPEVIGCGPADDLATAERLMAEEHVARILVLDDERGLLGLITLTDIARRADEQEAGSTLRRIADQVAPSLH